MKKKLFILSKIICNRKLLYPTVQKSCLLVSLDHLLNLSQLWLGFPKIQDDQLNIMRKIPLS